MTNPTPTPQAQPIRTRWRIRFGKEGGLRYISHLDVARVWERTLRRAMLPVVYSQGFNPRPKIQLAAALPLGYASTAELLDVWLNGEYPVPDGEIDRLHSVAPEGLRLYSIEQVELRGKALQALTHSAHYEFSFRDPIDREDLSRLVEGFLSRESVIRERRNKEYDLRPLVLALEVSPDDPPQLLIRLALSQQKGTGRADELLDELGFDISSINITRTAILYHEEG